MSQIEEIRAFVMVVETGSLTQAAERLGIAVSAVSGVIFVSVSGLNAFGSRPGATLPVHRERSSSEYDARHAPPPASASLVEGRASARSIAAPTTIGRGRTCPR